MSTRAVYGFKDKYGTQHVYVHHDGYPSGAASKFNTTLKSGKVWPLPRFEADEFAAGFVAANKKSDGGVRLTKGPEDHRDIEYYYLVTQADDGRLMIKAVALHYEKTNYDDGAFYEGTLESFMERAEEIDKKISEGEL